MHVPVYTCDFVLNASTLAVPNPLPPPLSSCSQRDRVFSAVDSPNNNTEWTDFSVNCHYVGTFEVGEQSKVDKQEVKRGTWWRLNKTALVCSTDTEST